MYLKRLSLINFKNIGQEEFPLTPGINCFVGDNGAGKTNFIDAIHYLSMCKSAFSMTDTQSVRHGEEFFLLEGSYERSDGRGEQIVCSFARRGGKTLKRNGKEYDRLSENFRRLGGYDMEHERNRVANGLDIPAAMRAQPFDSLSGGEKTRVNLARLILEDTDILLLDEPTNCLLYTSDAADE